MSDKESKSWRFVVENDPECNREFENHRQAAAELAITIKHKPELRSRVVTPSGKEYVVTHGDQKQIEMDLAKLEGIRE